MGVDEGFDLYPPLENNDTDNEKWDHFLSNVISYYEEKADSNMTFNADGDIVFTQGEHPTLFRKAYRFRRFSATIYGRNAGNVSEYLREVREIARGTFRAAKGQVVERGSG